MVVKGKPIFWWSPDPRMVLYPQEFKFSRSLRKTLKKFLQQPGHEIRLDTDFSAVIHACASISRAGQSGTWIQPEMIQAYSLLHQAGLAHSVETWVEGQLVGGLYGIAIGGMFFGESMFARQTDASKLALCGLIAYARYYGIKLIDCQQLTQHLTSFGGRSIAREAFIEQMKHAQECPCAPWATRAPAREIWHTLLA